MPAGARNRRKASVKIRRNIALEFIHIDPKAIMLYCITFFAFNSKAEILQFCAEEFGRKKYKVYEIGSC